MPRVMTVDCLLVAIVQLILLNFIGAQEEILKCMIKDGKNEIHLNLRKTNQLLANVNLPIWMAKGGGTTSCKFDRGAMCHELIPNFMEEHIGDFTAYHDKEKSAAVVYFKNTGTLHGIIDTRYVILRMPLDECNQGHQAGEEYVRRREGYMDVHESLKSLQPLISYNEKINEYRSGPSTSTQCELSIKRRRVDSKVDGTQVTTFYPEILVLVTNDVINTLKDGRLRKISLATIIRYYIEYFNAIDMLLSKLSTDDIKIHLNLAGIVIESKSNLFPFIKVVEPTPQKIDTQYTMKTIPDYFETNKDIFPDDSFDFYFLSTKSLLLTNIDFEKTLDAAISTDPDFHDTFKRRQDPINERYMLGTMVQHYTLCEYITATHEIAHLLGIKHDPREEGYANAYDQCHAIMQQYAKYCADCLKWTDRSIQNLKKYARENRNLPTILPLDGTPCSDSKVCWGRICQNLPLVPKSSSLEEISGTQQEILETTIKDGENEIHLKWRKTNQLLANINLPVWTANLSPGDSSVKHELKPTLVKEEIGEFVMYHDLEHSSAVVYFKKQNVLHGIIDARYAINGLPYTELNQVQMVDGPYVKKLSKFEQHTKLSDPLIPHDQIDPEPSTSSQDEPPEKRPRTHCTTSTSQAPTMYPEVLVFAAYDVTQFTKAIDPINYLTTMVRRYIIYFNAVDMLFAKLSAHDVNIHINIAGIVIDENNIFPMVKSSFPPPLEIFENFIRFDAPKTLDLMKNYIKKNSKLFVEDSFDFFFISTGSIIQEYNIKLRGRALVEPNVYIARLSETTYDHLSGLVGLRDLVPASNCNKKLVCENIGPYGNTPRPLDGTPCGPEKVCWKRKCQEIPNAV
ncbi:hypothetical protein PV327_002301 [Microctonus hyperodae]|uniref:Uncharacterized protein n=1 Tax=Microctonus hyperodae TaxID=165561 RepID=A0AA39FFA5_MICHY|nr:hypothetical protein PV327_002301 [Microctonus hyperodae]